MRLLSDEGFVSDIRFAEYSVVKSRLLAFLGVCLIVDVAVAAPTVRQVMKTPRYTRGDENVRAVQPADAAAWIWKPGHEVYGAAAGQESWQARAKAGDAPSWFFLFRNDFFSNGMKLRFDVSADERFVLCLDGKPIARGPQRGMVEHWYYQSYEIDGLEPGAHRLDVVCWQLSASSPNAQLSYRGGFLLKAEGGYDEQLTTGKGRWRVAQLANTTMTDRGTSDAFGTGTQCRVIGTGILREEPAAGDWSSATVVRRAVGQDRWWERQAGWMLFPADRPDQMYEVKTPGRIVNVVHDLTKPFVVPSNAEMDLWWDLGDYYCAYPELETSGGKGASVVWGWAESLHDDKDFKGNRNEWKGKRFSHVFSDAFVSDGRDDAFFTSPWWRCGRWCRVTLKTADEPLEVRRIAIGETRYPLSVDFSFKCDDPSVDDIVRISRRTVESCMHEMLFDCPYYEQQMYPGDTRIQLQILNALTADPRMARFAISVYDWSRRDSGFVPMNFPSRALQESCTYTMCWIMMLRDHLYWRNDLSFLRERMPGVRAALDGLSRFEDAEGLLSNMPGWSFVDWVKDWSNANPEAPVGCAPSGRFGTEVSSINNLLYLMSLQAAEAVDATLGERELAARWHRKASRLGKSVLNRFWSDERGLIADTESKECFSEHAQALGILTGVLEGVRREHAVAALVDRRGVAPASSYFSYYILEALTHSDRADIVLERLGCWRNYLTLGACTTFETQHADARSDCHAWSASPIYFLSSAIAGVRPAEPCYRSVRIAPQPGPLKWIKTTSPTPKGEIRLDLRFDGMAVRGSVCLPQELSGEFQWRGRSLRLKPGATDVNME